MEAVQRSILTIFNIFKNMFFVLLEGSRAVLGPTQVSITRLPAISSWVKRPGLEADHSRPTKWRISGTITLFSDTPIQQVLEKLTFPFFASKFKLFFYPDENCLFLRNVATCRT
jgi:hypothetical protein